MKILHYSTHSDWFESRARMPTQIVENDFQLARKRCSLSAEVVELGEL